MTLTHQFLITLALPAAFLVLSLYAWRQCRTRQYGLYWALTLFVAALWTSSLLSYYVGSAVDAELVYLWRAAARHIFTIVASLVLLTTMVFLNTPRGHRRLILAIGALFWTLALLFDPGIVPYDFMEWKGTLQPETHFHLWASMWVTAWILPLVAGMMLTREAMHRAMSALYRNHLNYWFVTLLLLMVSGLVAMIQEPGQPAWQELGALGALLTAILGVRTLTRNNLTNLAIAIRHAVARLAASLFILLLAWFLLYVVVEGISQQQPEPSILELGLAATFFTVLFSAIYRYVPDVVRRILLRNEQYRAFVLADEPAVTAALPDPAALAEILLRMTQSNIDTESATLFMVDTLDDAMLRFAPVASVGIRETYDTLELAAGSAFITRLRQRPPTPLSTYELEALPAFSDMAPEDKRRLHEAKIELFMPLSAGDELVGVLALGDKFTGESYTHAELAWLQDISAHGGLLLWQANNLKRNSGDFEHVQEKLSALQHEIRTLRERLTLHERFAHLITPALREPFVAIHHTIDDIQREHRANGVTPAINALNQQLARLRLALDNIIVTAGRVGNQQDLKLQEIDLGDIVDRAAHDLQTMSSARRVTVNVIGTPNLPSISGDERRLYEAIQHLIHNAIRFNRIGGCVDVEYGISNDQLCVHVRDDGLGIPEEQLATLWDGAPLAPVDNSVKGGGSLGLALTRYIIRAHNGTIEVESLPELGATFSIYLPLPGKALPAG